MEASLTKTPVLWERLTWEEIEALRRGGMDMTILPVGSTEQHGPHLSLEIDTVSAALVARGVAEDRLRGVGSGEATSWLVLHGLASDVESTIAQEAARDVSFQVLVWND